MVNYISIQEAKAMSGLRVVLAAGSISPWSEALKQILFLKRVPFAWVKPKMPGPDPELQAWTAQTSMPVAVWNDERPRSGWIEQLYLAERLGPEPALIPASIDDRIMMFGLINEVAGENGLSWCKRLIMLHQRITDDSGTPVVHHRFKDREGFVNYARYLGGKYGYDPEAVAKAPDRVANILARLNAQLQRQRQAGSKYFLGQQLSALDVYSASFSLTLSPSPREWTPTMSPAQRAGITPEPLMERFAELIDHRNFIYSEHLKLPIEF
jgi:glutathione S-transferase